MAKTLYRPALGPVILCVLGACLTTAALAAPVAIPFTENFDSGSSAFASGGSWSHAEQKYHANVTGNGTYTASTIEAPLLPNGFRMEATLSSFTGTGGDSSCGFGFLGTNAALSGGDSPYYLADVRPGISRVRLIQVASPNTNFIDNEALSFTLNPAQPFKLTVEGNYDGPVLRMKVIVSQDSNQSIHAFDDDTPLAGRYFGFRARSVGVSATLGVDYDDFSLREYATVQFTSSPSAYARPGVAYSSAIAATSSNGATVGFSITGAPSWLAITDHGNGTGTLSGTPPSGATGAFSINVAAQTPDGTTSTREFPIRVLGASGVIISEFVASSDGAILDEDGEESDWLEIFNTEASPADVSGWMLKDDKTSWTLPAGTVLPPFGHRIVFASDKNRTAPELHANFKLSASAGGYLALVRPDLSIAYEYANYPAQEKGAAYGVWGDYQPIGYLIPPTPDGPNPATGFIAFAPIPTFSVQRGFYTSPQSLTLSSSLPGSTISYTMDGTAPSPTNGTLILPADPASLPSASISVTGTSVIRAAAFKQDHVPSLSVTHTYLFPDDLVTQSANEIPPAGWPTGTVNGQILQYGMDPDIINSPAKAEELKTALRSLPTFSVVTDRKHFFDPTTGIYVNAYGREKEWERPTSMEMIRPDGSSAFQVNCGIRMRGGVSRDDSNPKHSFHFYFRSEYGAGKLKFPLFDNEGAAEFDRIDLRSTQGSSAWHTSGAANATYMKDEWSRATQGAMGHAHARSRFVHLYINGQYWGIYATQERADNAFAASYFGGDKEDYDIIKTYTLPHRVEAADGDAVAWTALYNAAVTGFTDDAAYHAVQGLNPDGSASSTIKPLVDIDNLIDYMILNMFTSNTDGPVNPGDKNVPKNFFCFRPRDGSAGFKFVAHDFEDTFGGTDVTGHLTTDGKNPVAGDTLIYFNPRWLHLRLTGNPNYLRRFGDRVQHNLFNNGALTAASSTARWAAMRSILSPAMIAESARWGDAKSATPRTVADWNSACNGFFNPSNNSGTLVNRPTSFISLLRSTSRGYRLFPSIDAPGFSQFGGIITPGQLLSITGPASSQIWYTLDGSDPSSPTALLYTGPVSLSSAHITVKARAKQTSTGEWSALTEATFTTAPIPAAAGNLILAEMHYNPSDGSDTRDFIELLNISPYIVDLDGVKVTTGLNFTFSPQLLLPGERIVIVENDTAFRAFYGTTAKVAGVWDGNLANSGETITVLAKNASTIESVTYSDTAPWPTQPDGKGPSLVRIHPSLPADSASSWRRSTGNHGTPGEADAPSLSYWLTENHLPNPDTIAPSGARALAHFAAGIPLGSAQPPSFGMEINGANVDLSFVRRISAVDEIRFFIDQSPDLSGWPISTEVDGTSTLIQRQANADGTENISVKLPADPAPMFYRLRYSTR